MSKLVHFFRMRSKINSAFDCAVLAKVLVIVEGREGDARERMGGRTAEERVGCKKG